MDNHQMELADAMAARGACSCPSPLVLVPLQLFLASCASSPQASLFQIISPCRCRIYVFIVHTTYF
eukprot:442297-Hanusia_phi.AAC.1